MGISTRRRAHHSFVLLAALFLLSACRAGEEVADLDPTDDIMVAVPDTLVTIPALASVLASSVTPSVETPQPSPSSTAALAPDATSTPAPTAVATPVPTVDSEAGLPCPAELPMRPTYQSYNLGLEPYPTPDVALSVPLWLDRPVAGEGPLRLNLTFPYGSDGGGRYLLHNGIDTTEPLGTPVVAVADGTVIVAGPDADILFGWRCDWYGELVVVRLDEPWQGEPVYALYGHVLNVLVEEGQRVAAGEPLAEIGFGGVATAPHLHFEIRVGANRFNATRNPALWLRPSDPYGILAGRLVDPAGHPWEGVTVTLITLGEETEYINTFTYLNDPEHLINPEPGVAENFVFGQLPTGTYDLFVKLQGVEYRQRVTISPSELTTAEIVTEPYKTPTPGSGAPAATPSP